MHFWVYSISLIMKTMRKRSKIIIFSFILLTSIIFILLSEESEEGTISLEEEHSIYLYLAQAWNVSMSIVINNNWSIQSSAWSAADDKNEFSTNFKILERL